MPRLIYKICAASQWRDAGESRVFNGAAVDLADGFIHFSTASQVRETAAKHFAGQGDLVLVAVDEAKLGPALKYEISRGGQLFPHLYGPLSLDAVEWIAELPLNAQGSHQFPPLE